jgi:hypothetical protein
MKKKCFITIVNQDYKEYIGQLIKSHSLFSNVDLIVYTINFELTDIKSEKVIFKQYFDKNLWEYENSNSNDIIKNQYEKHKYTTLLKPLILKESLNENYDDFLFIDCDGLLTKNSDVFFTNILTSIGDYDFPISVKYFYQYSTGHEINVPIFDEYGQYNIESAGYYPLIELYGTEHYIIDYVATYCMLYNKSCISFIDEVINICFDPNVISDYKKYLPMGDETVFNYLYSKYNFSKYISSNICFDVSPFLPISDVINNLEKTKNFVSYIHTKRYTTFNPYSKDFSNLRYDEYEQIFNILLGKELCNSNITIFDVRKNKNAEEIHFFVKDDYSGDCYVKVISLFRPNKEYKFNVNINNDIIFYIIKEKDVWVKDSHLLIEQNQIIKDVVKIL